MRYPRIYRYLGWKRLSLHPVADLPKPPLRQRLQAWTARSTLFNSAWGYGLCLAAVLLLSQIAMPSNYCRVGPLFCLWFVLSSDLGILTASAAAFAFVRRRPDDGWLMHVVLLAGLTYLLYFPSSAAALSIGGELLQLVLPQSTVASGERDLLVRFFSYWWGGFGGFDTYLLIGIAVCTVAYCLARRRGSDGYRSRAVLLRDVAVGMLLIAFGIVIGVLRHDGILAAIEEQIAAAKTWNHKPWLDGAEYLRSQLWNIVLQSALPYVIIGGILVLPLRLASHKPRE